MGPVLIFFAVVKVLKTFETILTSEICLILDFASFVPKLSKIQYDISLSVPYLSTSTHVSFLRRQKQVEIPQGRGK